MGACFCIRAEHLVDGLEQVSENLAPLLGASLNDRNKVVQVEIGDGRCAILIPYRGLFPAGF